MFGAKRYHVFLWNPAESAYELAYSLYLRENAELAIEAWADEGRDAYVIGW